MSFSGNSEEYYIVDVRDAFKANPYITMWRPNDAGYAYPTQWSGRYSKEQIDSSPHRYHKKKYGKKTAMERYPVPCSVVEKYAVEPQKGLIDGDTGLVLPNTPEIRKTLRKAKYNPEGAA